MARRKQLTFDVDTNVAKKVLGEQNYTNIYANIRKFMEQAGWEHIEGSVYVSSRPMDSVEVAYLIKNMIKQYPYLEKCVRAMHQTDISQIHSLNHLFEYDGTPGRYEQRDYGHKKAPPSKPSVINKLKKNKEIIKQQERQEEVESRKKTYDRGI